MPINSKALGAVLALAAITGLAQAQAQTADEHAAHHPPTTPGEAQAPGALPPSGGSMQPGGASSGTPAMMGGDMGRMMQGDMGQMMQRMHAMMARGAGPMMRDMQSLRHIEGQVAFYRTELKITDAQLPQWNAFAEALRSGAQRMQAAIMHAMQSGTSAPAPEQLERRIAVVSAQLETLRAIQAAATPLYAVLSDEQKKVADELMAEHMQRM
jgi:hypothetical protein